VVILCVAAAALFWIFDRALDEIRGCARGANAAWVCDNLKTHMVLESIIVALLAAAAFLLTSRTRS
jgi:hypothetical protein